MHVQILSKYKTASPVICRDLNTSNDLLLSQPCLFRMRPWGDPTPFPFTARPLK